MSTMDSPILLLDTGAWTYIATFLSYDDVKGLILTGDRRFTQLVGLATDALIVDRHLAVVDFEGVLATARFTPNLRTIRVGEAEGICYLMKPLQPLQLPPKLTTLYADVFNSLDFFLTSHDLSTLAPELLNLRLEGDDSKRAMDFKLPSKLERLELPGQLLTLQSGDIAKLPRSLVYLYIRTKRLPLMTYNEWPAELTSLFLSGLRKPLTAEHLPRTLTSLDISSRSELNTTFKHENVDSFFAFPWRRFFPHLSSLFLNVSTSSPSMNLVTSIISPTALNASDVGDFLKSDFWRSDLLDATPTTGYPLFERLEFIDVDEDIVEVARTLAPFLRKVASFGELGMVPIEAFNYLPSVTLCIPSDDVITLPESGAFPTHLTSATFDTVDVAVINHLSSLESLTFSGFSEDESNPEAANDIKWPSKLTELATSVTLGAPALQSLPTSLTILRALISTNTEWDLIATRLVNLNSLRLTLATENWTCPATLAPIASTVLGEVVLCFAGERLEGSSAPLVEEFVGKRSPLPSSLTDLTLSGLHDSQLISMSMLFHMAKWNLRALSLSPIMWNDAPGDSSFALAQLASLPASLESLYLGQLVDAPREFQSVSTLAALPRGLTTFIQREAFCRVTSDDDMEELVKNLPPKLTFLYYDLEIIPDIYFTFKRPYLYQRAEPSPTS